MVDNDVLARSGSAVKVVAATETKSCVSYNNICTLELHRSTCYSDALTGRRLTCDSRVAVNIETSLRLACCRVDMDGTAHAENDGTRISLVAVRSVAAFKTVTQ